MACATFGLILGGVLGGPVAQWLIRRHRLQSTTDAVRTLGPGTVPRRSAAR
jgi:ESS family glutamate:Na+ symporter